MTRLFDWESATPAQKLREEFRVLTEMESLAEDIYRETWCPTIKPRDPRVDTTYNIRKAVFRRYNAGTLHISSILTVLIAYIECGGDNVRDLVSQEIFHHAATGRAVPRPPQ